MLCLIRPVYADTITLESGDIIQCQVVGKDDAIMSQETRDKLIQKKYLDNLVEIKGDSSVYNQKPAPPPSKEQTDIEAAMKLIDKGELDLAELILKKLIIKIPDNWQPRMKSRGIYSIAFWDTKEYQESLNCEQKVLGTTNKIYLTGPSYSGAYYWLSSVEVARNNPDIALDYLDIAERLEPDHPLIFNKRGYIFNRMGRYEAGYEELERALNVRQCIPDYQRAEVYSGMGVSLIGLAKFQAAKDAFKKSLEYDPENKMAYNGLEYVEHLMNLYVLGN